MDLDFGALAGQIGDRIGTVLAGHGKTAGGFARAEGEKIALAIKHIAEMVRDGEILPEEAPLYLDIQMQHSRAVLRTVEGIGLVAAEQAINGALDLLKGAVTTALGFPLVR
jgi:hypothetical protein